MRVILLRFAGGQSGHDDHRGKRWQENDGPFQSGGWTGVRKGCFSTLHSLNATKSRRPSGGLL